MSDDAELCPRPREDAGKLFRAWLKRFRAQQIGSHPWT